MIHPLVSATQLHELLGQPSVRVFDCRYSLMDPLHGKTAYSQSHLSGAEFIDLNRDLSTPHIPGKTGRHPLPQKTAWLATVQRLGLAPAQLVVLYDDGGGASSARLWWMLQWIGHSKVVVLDGGWQAWIAAALPTSTEPPAPHAATTDHYSALPSLVQLLEADSIDGAKQLLLDARELPRFKGEVEPLDPVAGHIAGAVCSPFSGNLQADGRFKSAVELREKFKVAIGSTKPVVCYCGSGITACHNILAMAAAGLPLPALYAGSWSEWITDPSRPVALGEAS